MIGLFARRYRTPSKRFLPASSGGWVLLLGGKTGTRYVSLPINSKIRWENISYGANKASKGAAMLPLGEFFQQEEPPSVLWRWTLHDHQSWQHCWREEKQEAAWNGIEGTFGCFHDLYDITKKYVESRRLPRQTEGRAEHRRPFSKTGHGQIFMTRYRYRHSPSKVDKLPTSYPRLLLGTYSHPSLFEERNITSSLLISDWYHCISGSKLN